MDRQSARKLTKNKRQSQTCKVYELKIDRSHLSQRSLDHLYSLFREAKWFYNYCLSLENVNEADYTAKSVLVKVKDYFEERKFTVLKGQMKQSIKTRTFGSIKALSTLKKKGKKVGRLKFKSQVNSVPLVQLGTNKHSGTYYIDKERSRVRIQGMTQWLRVRGLEQIKDDVDIANATLVRKCDDFYVQVTTFENKEETVIPEESIGIDFGCQTQLTFSNGIKAEFQVPVSDKLKRLDRKIDKKVNGKTGKNRPSNNRRKLQQQRRKEYERITNKKKDIRNKIVSAITKNYKYVVFQDESIHAWHAGNHGKKVQHSGIGGIISDLKHKSHTPVMVDKFFPSTQLCPQCGALNKLKVSDRIYECECGFVEDRDVKSAVCIETEGLKNVKIPTDHRKFKLEESSSSTFLNMLTNINGIKVSKKNSLSQEAAGLALP